LSQLTASNVSTVITSTRVLLVALVLIAGWYAWTWFAIERRRSAPGARSARAPEDVALGFATDFFDTLGIGGFAPTTAIFKLFRPVPDELIPGTLNVGHALPTLTEALIFIAAVTVDPLTLISMIAASVLGAWLGAGLVARLPRRAVQLGMSTGGRRRPAPHDQPWLDARRRGGCRPWRSAACLCGGRKLRPGGAARQATARGRPSA
jgi:uncharacterized membrane protein YfcA